MFGQNYENRHVNYVYQIVNDDVSVISSTSDSADSDDRDDVASVCPSEPEVVK